MMKMSADFSDFLKLLSDKKVEYLLIGGYAVVYYGYVRDTGDMDIWIRMTEKNTDLAAEVLEEVGYAPKSDTVPYLREPGKIIRMGIPPFRLEVSTSIDGVEFDECFANRTIFYLDETPVNLISLDDLLKNKIASGRLKDLADVEELEIRNRKYE
jgi:predicted nucleotidyltransferase